MHEDIDKRLRFYLNKFENDEQYMLGYKAVRQMFDSYPTNTNKLQVLLKASTLNGLYNTVIFDITKMSKHIQNLAIDKTLDKILQSGDLEAINKIRIGHGIRRKNSTVDMDFYSFSTKYCQFSNPQRYPMYDSNVEKAIKDLQNQEYIPLKKQQNLKNPLHLKEVVDNVIKQVGFDGYLEADHALWVWGETLKKQ